MDNPPKNQTQNRWAIIDVGSNSVKLLVADVAEGVVTPIVHKGEQTRLGRGVFDTGRLLPEAISDTASVVSAFAARAKEEGAETVRVLATSAVREAENSDQLAAAVAAGGLELEIIDGQTEAQLVLRGVRSLPDLATGPLAIIDVGGGSTELLVADDAALRLQHSFPLGTVRWLGLYCVSETPTTAERAKLAQALDDFLDEQVTPKLGGVLLPGTLVGAGGTPIFLSRIYKERDDLAVDEIESLRLSLPEVQALTNRLWQMPLAARGKLPGLPANRADVILFGAAIYEAVWLQRTPTDTARCPVRGTVINRGVCVRVLRSDRSFPQDNHRWRGVALQLQCGRGIGCRWHRGVSENIRRALPTVSRPAGSARGPLGCSKGFCKDIRAARGWFLDAWNYIG